MTPAPFESDESDAGDRQPTGLVRDPSSHVDTLLALTDLVNEDPEGAVRQVAGELRDLTDSRLSAIYLLSDGVLVPLAVCSGGEFLFGLGACTCRLVDHPDAAAVLDAGLPLALRDYGRPSYRRGAAGAGDDDGRYASALLLPLAARGEAIGLVELCDTAPSGWRRWRPAPCCWSASAAVWGPASASPPSSSSSAAPWSAPAHSPSSCRRSRRCSWPRSRSSTARSGGSRADA
jgi:hypothetical protein